MAELAPAFILKSIIEVSHVEFLSYDVYQSRLVCTSGVAQKILGYSKEEYTEFSKNYYHDIIHPDDYGKIKASIDKVIDSPPGEIVELTSRFKKSDGNYIWVYSRKIVSERNAEGKPVLITTVAEDITKLVTTQEQLKEKIQQLNEISYKNSHMLRGPVASILGLIDQVEENNITSSHNITVFNYLKEAIKKLDEVIHEINDISRP